MQDPNYKEVERFVREEEAPFVTTADVWEEFGAEYGVTKRTVVKRLNELARRDKIEKRNIGSNAVVWYVDD